MKRSNLYLMAFAILFLGACSSHPVIPEKEDIKITRDNPDSDCKEIGPIEGRTNKLKAKPEDAIEDMKSEAIKKGANFVKIETFGAMNSSVRGTAYYCD